MKLSSNVFNEVVQQLENHPESLRIKKLIFCICKKYWENDTNILNTVPLDDLIQELIQVKPNSEQLTFSVYKLVKTLNRPRVYAPVGKFIIEQVGLLYSNTKVTEEDTELLPVEVEERKLNPNTELLIDQVVANLANNTEQSRIKKLIFAACKNKWENNTAIIDKYGLKNLILELRQVNLSKNELRQAFNRIVDNINKKGLYLAIAKVILGHMEILYDTNVEFEEDKKEQEEPTQIYDTQIVPLDKRQNQSPNITPRQYRESNALATSIVEFNPDELRREIEQNQTVNIPFPVQRIEYDAFETRLQIVQFTNPLRAKILLFSIVLHPWDESGQDWSTLRSYTLEDLLDQIIQSGKPIKEIESRLQALAKKQKDVESSLQTASVIVQAIQHIMEK